MEAMEALLTRRSTKNFKPDVMPGAEDIEKVIEAGLYAANGKGEQSAIIVAVTNKELRDKLSAANCRIGGWNPRFDPFYGAPVVLIVLGRKDWFTHVYDGSLVIGNMLLAAHALGLGSCWVHRAKEEFEEEEWKNFLKDLGVEGEYEGVGHCILGVPDMEPHAAPRKESRVFYVK